MMMIKPTYSNLLIVSVYKRPDLILSSLVTTAATATTSLPCTNSIIKGIAAKRARTLVTRREPLEQAPSMKQVFTRVAALIRHLLITADQTIADSTLGLAFQGTDYILSEDEERVGDRAVRESDSTLGIHKPAGPLLLTNSDTGHAFYLNAIKRVGGRKFDDDLKHSVIDLVASEHFSSFTGNFDYELLLIFHLVDFLVFRPC